MTGLAQLPGDQATTAQSTHTSTTSTSRTAKDTTQHMTSTRSTRTPNPEPESSSNLLSAPHDGSPTTILSPSSSTIHWGPAITAPSYSESRLAPTPPPQAPPTEPSSGFSDNAQKAVIAATTVGGTIVLLFLLYALWRRRKGHSYSEIVHFRRHSGTIILGGSRGERLTALPIYHETRYSVRSSKQCSSLNVGRHGRRPSAVPPSVAQRFYTQNPWVHDIRTASEPPTPSLPKHPLSQVATAGAPELKAPEMVRVYSSQGLRDELPQHTSDTKPGPSVAVRPTSIRKEGKEDVESDDALGTGHPDRWSWTNSQAPPTPRYAPSMHSSLSSLPRFRKVKSWVRHQSVRNAARIDEERGPHSRSTSDMPILKNKASKPNLAPKPTRKLSKKSLNSNHDSPLIIQSNNDSAGPVHPPPAWVRNNSSFPRIAPI